VSKSLEVVLPTENGLHARPATKFVEMASRFSSDICISKDGTSVSGKSVIEILTLAAEYGSKLLISAEGEDEEEAVEALVKLVEKSFQE